MNFQDNKEYEKTQLAVAKLLNNSLNLVESVKNMVKDGTLISFTNASGVLTGGTTMLTGAMVWDKVHPTMILLGIVPTADRIQKGIPDLFTGLRFNCEGETVKIYLIKSEDPYLESEVAIEVL
ncbi:hypothetical protein KBC03_04810 [Patescibacteria group bacterium]|nr:hypothetical protein [Patescibacteria group bacterium]